MAHEPEKAYPSEVVNGTSLMHNVPIADMFVHFRTEPGGYARPLRQWRVNYLIATWDPQALGVILLSLRDDGSLAELDGQHRVAAAKHFGLTGLDAQIYVDLTLEDEARLYRKFGDYLKQTPLDRYHAGVAERVPEYLAIQRVLATHDLHVPQTLGPSGHGVVAVDALIRVSTMYGLETLDETLTLLNSAWPNDSRAYRGMSLNGTAAFLVRYAKDSHFRRRLLISRLTRTGISNIEQRTMGIRNVPGLAQNPNAAWGMALRAAHNFRLPDEDHLPEWAHRHFTEQGREASKRNMKKVLDGLTPEKRSEMAKKAAASMTPEKRTARGLKSAKTRKGYSVRQVQCPYCLAGDGAPCVTRNDLELPNYHKQRRDAAKQWANGKMKP